MRLYDEIFRRRDEGTISLRDQVLWRIRQISEQDRGPVDLRTPINREAFADVLDAYSPDGYQLVLVDGDRRCHAFHTEGGWIEFCGRLCSDGDQVAHLERTIHFGRNYASHHSLEVVHRFRGNRIGPRCFIGSVDLYDRLSISEIIVRAAKSGTWYWAQFGFHFMHDYELEAVRNHAQFFIDAFGGGLDAWSLEHPQQFLRLGEFDGAVVTFDQVCEAYGDSQATREQVEFVAHEEGKGMHEPIPLGRMLLLTGPNWWGSLNLGEGTADRLIYDDFSRRILDS